MDGRALPSPKNPANKALGLDQLWRARTHRHGIGWARALPPLIVLLIALAGCAPSPARQLSQMNAQLSANPRLDQSLVAYERMFDELEHATMAVALLEPPLRTLDAFRSATPALWAATISLTGVGGLVDNLLEGALRIIETASAFAEFRLEFSETRQRYVAAWERANANPTQANVSEVGRAAHTLAASLHALGERVFRVRQGLSEGATLIRRAHDELRALDVASGGNITRALLELEQAFQEPIQQLDMLLAALNADIQTLTKIKAQAGI